jgi:hypothetical protein
VLLVDSRHMQQPSRTCAVTRVSLNTEDELHPLNQAAFTMLLREVTEHGSSELEARFDDLMYGLHPDHVAVFRLRLEERRTRLHDHPNTIAHHESSTPVASQPSMPTPTAKAADDLADQLQSVRITGGATHMSQRTTPTPTSTPTPTPAPANRAVAPPLRLNTAPTPVPMTQPTTHTHAPQTQTPPDQQVADMQQQVQQMMTLVKGRWEAVTPRELADFLAAQTALAECVTLAESKVNKSPDLAQRALDAANSALNTLPQCVSVELATSLQTQINGTVTGINDINGRLADIKTQLDARPPNDNPATMPVDVEDLANLRSALDDRIDHSARTTEDIHTTLNAHIDTEVARIAQPTKSADDLERKSALFLDFTPQPLLDADATNTRIAEALPSADTANVTADNAHGPANTANQTVDHMRTRFDSIDTALANTTHDFNYVWSHIALLLDKSSPTWRGVTYARPTPMAFTEPSVTLEPTLYHMRVVPNPPTAAAMTNPPPLNLSNLNYDISDLPIFSDLPPRTQTTRPSYVDAARFSRPSPSADVGPDVRLPQPTPPHAGPQLATTLGVAPVQILTPGQQRATQPVTPPSAPQPEQPAPNTASPPATSRSVMSDDAFEFGPSPAGTPRKVALRLNRELAPLTSGCESTRPDLSLDRKSRRTRYSRDDDAAAAPVSPRSQQLADQVMEGVVSDDDADINVLVCAITADSFYQPRYASSYDDDRMSDLGRLDAILASAMPAVLDDSPPPTDSDTAAAATPGPSPTPRGGNPTALSAVPDHSQSQNIAETKTTAKAATTAKFTTTVGAEIARIAHTGQHHTTTTITTTKILQLHPGQ